MPNAQEPEDRAAHKTTQNPENNVNENPVASTLHYSTSKPSCDEPHHNPGEKSHAHLFIVVASGRNYGLDLTTRAKIGKQGNVRYVSNPVTGVAEHRLP
jgi:hypothetical protein